MDADFTQFIAVFARRTHIHIVVGVCLISPTLSCRSYNKGISRLSKVVIPVLRQASRASKERCGLSIVQSSFQLPAPAILWGIEIMEGRLLPGKYHGPCVYAQQKQHKLTFSAGQIIGQSWRQAGMQ